MANQETNEDFDIIDQSIKIRNYKCFGNEPQGFEKIYPINIIIGKNNSGKSSLIDMIEEVVKDETFKNQNRGPDKAAILISKKLSLKDISPNFRNRNDIINIEFLNKKFDFFIDIRTNEMKPVDNYLNENNLNHFIYYNHLRLIDIVTKFKRLSAERDIVSETQDFSEILDKKGKGATAIIWKFLSVKGFDQNIIKKNVLNSFNQITKPDIYFKDIIVKQENSTGGPIVEILFEDDNEIWVPISKMGSGVKTVLLVLLNLIVEPHIAKRSAGKEVPFMFAFEELENNLHPALQRRLFSYLFDYSIKNKVYFFITTHSNVVIDMFSNNSNVQIIHVRKEGSSSVVETVISQEGNRKILKDLDYKASDLLMSNGIIWVEGPSDAIYIEMLLELYKKKIGVENESSLSYTIQVLATAIWKYAGFNGMKWDDLKDGSSLANNVIELQKLNHNHLLITILR